MRSLDADARRIRPSTHPERIRSLVTGNSPTGHVFLTDLPLFSTVSPSGCGSNPSVSVSMNASFSTPQLHDRTVLGIWAHPDDEAYLSAGLMARTISTGGRVSCVHATLGEHGTDDPQRWPPGVLGPHRANELRAALGVLGVAESEVLGYPDGGCDRVEDHVAITALEIAIDRVRPDVIVTFGPDGITGHPDHITVGRWATAAWVNTRDAQLFYATATESFMTRYRDVHERLGLFDDTSPRLPDAEIEFEIRLSDDEVAVKRAILAAHASQTVGLATAMGEDVYRRWYDVESFRQPTSSEIRAASTMAGVA
jgi:LmbE family N-acetylglucosaminyl deacetylase